jgi:hypothetical protein|nr:MAG TPA: hypothetical protein [Caudoviricetes sp.]
MAKNILSQVFPSDTAVSSIISQTRLDDVFVHCETNNRLAISTVRVVFLAALATCNPAVFDDIESGKNTLSDAIVESNNSDLFNFRAACGAFIKAYLAALEAKEIRRSLFEGRQPNDYVAFTKPNVDRILNVIAKTIADNVNKFDMAKAFKGFAFIANFLSNGRIDAAQADAILCSYGLVKPVAEQAQKDIATNKTPKCEAQKPVKYDAKLVEAAKALRDAYCSALSVRYFSVAKSVFAFSALSQAVAKASDFAVVEAEETGKYGEIIAKHAYLGHGRVITRYFTIAPECRLALKAQCEQAKGVQVEAIEEPNNDALLAAGKPLINVMGFFEVYKLKGGYEFNLTNLICKFLVYIRDNLATEAGKQYVEGVSFNISTDQRYQGFKHGTTSERIKVRAYNHYTGDYMEAARDLYPLDYVVNKSASLKYVLLNALMTEADNLGVNEDAYDDAAKFLDIYFATLNDLLEGKTVEAVKQEVAKQSAAEKAAELEAQFDAMAYLTEAEEQKIGEYTCKINRPVATDEERYWVCKGDYLQEHCALVKTGNNSYSWTQLDFSQAAKICEAAGVKIDADFSQAFLSTPLCHGGEKGPLLNTLGFISAYTSILFSSYGAAGNSAYQLAMAFERKIKKMFKDCLYDNGNYIYVPLNSFEGGLGKDYTYDKVAHMLLKLSINMLPKLKITEAKMRECLSSFLRLYRAMFYIFVQDDYWRYSQDPVTQDYIFTPYYDHKSHAA